MLNVQKNKIENDIIQKIIDINYSTIKIILRFSLDEERETERNNSLCNRDRIILCVSLHSMRISIT